MLKAKVRELEHTVNARIRIISHLEDSAKLSQKENDNLRQSHCHSESPLQSATLSCISQLGKDTLSTHVDKNYNTHPKSCTSSLATPALIVSHPSTPPSQGSNPQNSPNIFNYSPQSTHNHRNSEKFCQNCQNELPDDLDITLPSLYISTTF